MYSVNGVAVAGQASIPGINIIGSRKTEIDQEGHATDYFHDHSGRLTHVVQPAVADALNAGTLTRPVWAYGYDPDGNMTTITDPRGRVTTLRYDEAGRRVSRTLPAVSGQPDAAETTQYDHLGREVYRTDFKGNQTTFLYDTHGRLQEQRHFDPGDPTTGTPDVRYVTTYDALGRRDTVTETRGAVTRVTDYDHDPVTGQVSKVTSPEGTINYAYRAATGRMTRMWTPHNDTTYGYDPLGRLSTVTATKLNGQTVNLVTSYTYTKAGQVDLLTYPNGVVSDHDYDVLGRLVKLTSKRGTTTVFSQDYVLAPDGQRESVLEKREGQPDVFTDWTYDALNRLVSETRDAGNDGVQNGTDYAEAFTFDLSNNRRTRTYDAVGTSNDEVVTSTVDARDRLVSEDSSINANDAAYTFDTNGSLLTKTVNGTVAGSYAYDQLNRMVAATVAGVMNAVVYDHDGQRVRQTTGATTTHYLTDRHNPTGYPQNVEESSTADPSDTPDRSYLVAHAVVAQAAASAVQTLLRDGHGSVRALLNAAGAVVEAYDYRSYGEAVGFDLDTAATVHLFGGDGEYVAGVGLYDHARRWRAGPWFTQRDPITTDDVRRPLFLHRYAYANANPVHYTDPTGLFALADVTVAGGIRSLLSAMYSPIIPAAMRAAIGVQQGLTANQVLVGWALDVILEPLDMVVESVAAGLDLLEAGYAFVFDASGNPTATTDPARVDRAMATAGLGGTVIGLYYAVRRPASIYRAHHLNQRAVWESVLPENSASISLTEEEHRIVHREMRAFYRPYIGTPDTPTTAEYNLAMSGALETAGKRRSDIVACMRLIRAEQQRVGYPSFRPIPRVPTR